MNYLTSQILIEKYATYTKIGEMEITPKYFFNWYVIFTLITMERNVKQMIRGVKVRQPGSKPESKRPGKSQRSHTTAAGNGSSPSATTIATPKRH